MNRTFVLLAALVAGLPLAAGAQASPAVPQPATPAPTQALAAAPQAPSAPVAPSAYPTKIALVAVEQAIIATNEGQRAQAELQKKYEPRKAQLETEAKEIDGLNQQLKAAPATLSEEEKASRQKTIDTKEKEYELHLEDANSAFQTDMNQALGKIAQKFYPFLLDYVDKNGYTLLLNVSDSQQAPSPVLWTRHDPNADITEAVIAGYNAFSKVAAPAPDAPAATRPKPATGTTHPAAPHPAAPKPPSQ
jgi:outer membrane protein